MARQSSSSTKQAGSTSFCRNSFAIKSGEYAVSSSFSYFLLANDDWTGNTCFRENGGGANEATKNPEGCSACNAAMRRVRHNINMTVMKCMLIE
jgi:hypothetical protein